MKRYFKIIETIWKCLAYILAALMAALTLVVFFQILSRSIFKLETSWTQEVATLLFVWATYLGAALAIHNGSQISMTLLIVKTKPPMRQAISFLSALICEVFYGILLWAGIAAIQKFGHATTPALRIPMPWAYGAIAVSAVIMLVLGSVELIKPVLELKSLKQGEGE